MSHTFSPQTSPLSDHDPSSSIKPSSFPDVVPLRSWSPSTIPNDDRESTDSESAETETAKFFHNANAFSNSRGSSPAGTCSPGTYSGFSEVDSSTSPENLQRRRSNSAPLMPSLPPSVDGLMMDGSTWTPQSPFSSRFFVGSLPSKETSSALVSPSPNNIECWQTDTTNGSTGSTSSMVPPGLPIFRDSHGLHVPPRRGSNPPELQPLELGIAQGSRRGSGAFLDGLDDHVTTQGQGLAPGQGLELDGGPLDGGPLSPTSAQSLLYLLEAQAQAPPASPTPSQHTSPSPFPHGMGGCNAPVFVPHSMQQSSPSPQQPSSQHGSPYGMNNSWGNNETTGNGGTGSYSGGNNHGNGNNGLGNGIGDGVGHGNTGYHTPPSHRHQNQHNSLSSMGQELSLGDLQKSPSPYQQRSLYPPQSSTRSQLPPRSPQLLPQNHTYGSTNLGNGNGGSLLSGHSLTGTPTRHRSVSLPVPPSSIPSFNSMLENNHMRRLDQQTQSSLSNHTNYTSSISLADTFPPSNHHRLGETFPTFRGGNFPPTNNAGSRGHSQSPGRGGLSQSGLPSHQNVNLEIGGSNHQRSHPSTLHDGYMNDDFMNNQFHYEGQGPGHTSPATIPSSSPNAYYQLADRHRVPYDGPYFQVQFKRCHRCFILHAAAPVNVIKPGDFVIVEGDRGEDMGIVVAMAPRDSPMLATIFTACASTMGRNNPGDDPTHNLKKILRVASAQERGELPSKWQDELNLLDICRERARELYQLPMTLVDAEFQFDRHKLVLYYSASRRIDFREFVRDLFGIFKTRIWMEAATTHHSFRPSDAAIRALATGNLHHAVVTDANGHTVPAGTAAIGAGVNGGGINSGLINGGSIHTGIGGYNGGNIIMGGSLLGGSMMNIGGNDDDRFGHMLGLGLGVGAGGR